MTVERTWLLAAAPAVAALVALLAFLARRRRVRAAGAWSRSLGAEAASIGRRSPAILGVIALIAAVGLAGPRWGVAGRVTESRALNVVFVVDVSRSMLAEDAAPNRLTQATGIARRLVQDLEGDRLGLIAFAAHGYVLAPLTMDQSAISLQLDALDPEIASEGGSALGEALDQAREVLTRVTQGGDRAIVALTDGESHDGEAVLAAAGRSIRKDGITLVVVPIGDPNGARVPDGDGGYITDPLGNEVISQRRDDLVKAVVTPAGGVVVAASTADPAGEVRRVLDRLTRSPASDRVAADYIPRAWIFALVAAVLLLGHAWSRRSAALAGFLVLVGVATVTAQRPSAGARWLARGDTARAGAAFLGDAQRVGNDTAWFNAGTAALASGDFATAVPALSRASTSLDPTLRRRALYNLGTAMLVQARADTSRRDSLLTAASAALQSALLLDPADRNAKWNYELARRLRPPSPPPPPSGGGGGGDRGGDDPPPTPRKGGMSEAEAEQVLGAMERAERATRQAQWRRQRRGGQPPGPDW